MKNINRIVKWSMVAVLVLGLVACAKKKANPPTASEMKNAEIESKSETGSQPEGKAVAMLGDTALPALPDELVLGETVKNPKIFQAKKFMEEKKYQDLLGLIEPAEAGKMKSPEQAALAEVYLRAATQLRVHLHDVPFATMFCERGLLVSPRHPSLLRLQIDNYLQPDMNLVAGAEELAEKLVRLDPNDMQNQYLRGKVAFEQAEYDKAVSWLQKAARPESKGPLAEPAIKMLGMAKAKRDELKASLSMTKELEVMMARAKTMAKANPAADGSGNRMIADFDPKVAPSGGKVVLYRTKWCQYCKKTHALLKKLDIKFEERDIEKDQKALMRMMELAQQNGVEVTGVPVTQIGNKLVVGYNPSLIESMVKKIR